MSPGSEASRATPSQSSRVAGSAAIARFEGKDSQSSRGLKSRAAMVREVREEVEREQAQKGKYVKEQEQQPGPSQPDPNQPKVSGSFSGNLNYSTGSTGLLYLTWQSHFVP